MDATSWVCLLAGGCPAASNFLLRRQKKVTKEKATRLSGSFRFAPGNLRCSIPAGCVRTRFAQTTAALDTASICAARPGQTGFGGEGGFGEAETRKARPRRSPLPLPTLPPVGLGRGAQVKADQGERLSEPKASSSETPLLPSTAGLSYWGQTPISLRCFAPDPQGEPKAWRIGALTPKTPRPSGRLSFGYFSLATQRKVPRPPGRDPACWRTAAFRLCHKPDENSPC
jgi:hypothetical protein